MLLEAESFAKRGGWVVDSQSMETLHSSYLMAHGMGVPVEDAKTTLSVEKTGEYSVWALTRDWTAVWDVKDPAGKFQILVNGQPLPCVLGTNGKEWAWQFAGKISLEEGRHTLALHDLTGFNGRCDAIYLTEETTPPDSTPAALAHLFELRPEQLSVEQFVELTLLIS